MGGGGGGGGGYGARYLEVVPGQSFDLRIGTGGLGGAALTGDGTDGGDTVIKYTSSPVSEFVLKVPGGKGGGKARITLTPPREGLGGGVGVVATQCAANPPASAAPASDSIDCRTPTLGEGGYINPISHLHGTAFGGIGGAAPYGASGARPQLNPAAAYAKGRSPGGGGAGGSFFEVSGTAVAQPARAGSDGGKGKVIIWYGPGVY